MCVPAFRVYIHTLTVESYAAGDAAILTEPTYEATHYGELTGQADKGADGAILL